MQRPVKDDELFFRPELVIGEKQLVQAYFYI